MDPEGVGVGLSNDVPPQEKPFQNQKYPCSTPYKSFVEWYFISLKRN